MSGRKVPIASRATRRRSRTKRPGTRAVTKWVKRSGILVLPPEHAVLDPPAEPIADRPGIDEDDQNRQRVIQGTLPGPSRVELDGGRRERPGTDGPYDHADVGSGRRGVGRKHPDRAYASVDVESGRVRGQDLSSRQGQCLGSEIVREDGNLLDRRMDLAHEAAAAGAQGAEEQKGGGGLEDPPAVGEHP